MSLNFSLNSNKFQDFSRLDRDSGNHLRLVRYLICHQNKLLQLLVSLQVLSVDSCLDSCCHNCMPFVVVITSKCVISFCIQICLPHFWCHQDKSCFVVAHSVENNTRGSAYSTVEYVKENKTMTMVL